jgi:hypothetical protein
LGIFFGLSQIHRLIWELRLKLVAHAALLITSKVLDVRRRGATTEAYGLKRRKEERSLARLWRESNPPEADKHSPSALLRAMSLSNGR